VGALVRDVEQVLDRGHALFGGPAGGYAPVRDGGDELGDARERSGEARRPIAAATGVLAQRHRRFARDAARALDAAVAADAGLRVAVGEAGRTDQSGWATSKAVLTGAHNDAAGLAPLADTPAGQRALIGALRVRLAQQQHVVTACRNRDARLAAALRSLAYRGTGRRVGAPPLALLPFESGSHGGRRAGGGPLGWGSGGGAGTAAAARLGAPAVPVGTPLGALRPDSGPREVAAAIIGEAQRRGYSPYQTTAILADALQESGLNPRAVSPNRLWVSIFQQDASYPGRHNPNLAIAEFFNRLDRHGGPSSPDIWKSIFWLQQRPGEPSAEAAYAHGRTAYLTEIRGQHPRAVALFREITGAEPALWTEE